MQSSLLAISPLDGRYQAKTSSLQHFFSEKGLIYYRLKVEIEWLKSLHENPAITELQPLSQQAKNALDTILSDFDVKGAEDVKNIEATTNHDVKACEYYLKDKFSSDNSLKNSISFIHFGLTSEDVNNIAYNLMVKDGLTCIVIPAIECLEVAIKDFAMAHKKTAMMAKTHGQPATPTTVGKEFANVYWRLKNELNTLKSQRILTKCNGATGNYSALVAAYPNVDWPAHSKDFITSLELDFNPLTTQIEPHDSLAAIFHSLSRINTIFVDFARDCWSYISCGYFKQKMKENEVGSSTMPHKVNPIDFENAEGNFGIANALLLHFATKLPISRLQRDLSDSTVLRNIGSACAYGLIGYQSLQKGLSKIDVDNGVIDADLRAHYELLAEPIQTVMRQHGVLDAYEQLKAISRGKPLTKAMLTDFINQSTLPDSAKKELLALTPQSYIGLSVELVDSLLGHHQWAFRKPVASISLMF